MISYYYERRKLADAELLKFDLSVEVGLIMYYMYIYVYYVYVYNKPEQVYGGSV